MKFHIFAFFAVIILLSSSFTVTAQVDSVIGQVSSSLADSFAGGISGNGRYIVFESAGNHATVNPRNTDGNREIFLFDYAQRRIFQITDTRALLANAANPPTPNNVRVDIVNLRPSLSNDGRWIAFSSNATCAYPGNGTITAIVSTTNPGNFNANSPPLEPAANPNDPPVNRCLTGTAPNQTNNLVNDGNTEMWLYQIPAAPPVADLSAGDEIAFTDLSTGTFTRVTNTFPSRLPIAGSTTTLPLIADDNRDSSIDDTGAAISFTSNRDLVPCPATQTPSATCGNAAPQFDNDEIFSFVRASGTLTQLSASTRGTIANPIYNANSTITNLSTGGWRVAFLSNANNPIPGMSGSNADNNEEIFYLDLDAAGALGTTRRQVTTTTRTTPGDVVNILNFGRRMSRDGRYIAFDSFADLANEHNNVNQPGFATFVFDTTLATGAFRRVLPRSNADSGASGGDIQRYPGFTTALDSLGVPQTTLVFSTRMNIRASDGTIPTNAEEGLNNVPARQAQIYELLLNASADADPVKFVRLTKLPVPAFVLASVQPIPSNEVERMTFNLAQTETGTGNADLSVETYYYLLPDLDPDESPASFNYSTGATRIAITASPVPTPSATPTPTPTPTPTGSPSPSPSPTPQQPPAVQGASPGLLAILDYTTSTNQPVVARTAVGSLERRFTLPIELSGVTMTINGAAVGLKSVGQRQITFVVPPGLAASGAGTVYPVVVNNNGVIFRGNITIVPARPDIFSTVQGAGGRARVFNATNRVLTTEPFTVRTFRLRGSRLVPSVLRIYLTGVDGRVANQISVRIGNTPVTTVVSPAVLVEPGVYTIDFTIPPEFAGRGDQPIVVVVNVGGILYTSRLEDQAPRIFIL